VFQFGFVVLGLEAKSRGRDVIRREAQMSENVLATRRRFKALYANDRTLVTGPVTPSDR
jgi:hypothetical protein